jgi:Rrf2 family protein
MRIPAKSDYALRALVAIAAAGDGWVKAESLSDAEAIPFEYLQNILRDLRRAGLLRAQRGYDGGYRLSRPADAISVSDVLEAVASPLTEPYARSGSVWDALETSTRDLLGSTTVADLVVG